MTFFCFALKQTMAFSQSYKSKCKESSIYQSTVLWPELYITDFKCISISYGKTKHCRVMSRLVIEQIMITSTFDGFSIIKTSPEAF